MEDDAFGVAALSAPRQLSGLSAEIFEQAEAAHLERHYSSQLQGLRERETVASEVSAAVETVQGLIARLSQNDLK